MAVSPMLRALLLALSCVSSVMGASVICPSSMSAGETHTCFVAGLTPAALSSTTVKLSLDGVAQVDGVASQASPGLFSLTLPSDITLGDYLVMAESPGTFSQSVDVDVTAQAALVLLENDKALYKPGQTAKFRVLVVSLVQRLPLPGRQVQYAIVSPNGFKLLQAEATTDASGVAQFNFPIAAEPLQGEHVAQVSLVGASGASGSSVVSFGVEEYVLPRFEVTVVIDQDSLTAPSWSSSSDSTQKVDVTGTITATYTFGEGVRGKATVSAFKKLRAWEMPVMAVGGAPGAPGGDALEGGGGSGGGGTPYHLVGTLAGVDVSPPSGATFTLPVEKHNLNAGDLIIEVSVVDSVTNERQNATAEVPVVYPGNELNVHLATVDGAEVFKPGLPLMVRVEFKLPSGAGATAEQIGDSVEVTIDRNLVDYALRSDSTSVSLTGANFVDGVATATIPVPLEASDCCDPAAAPKDEREYKDMMGCCTSTINIRAKRDGETIWSGNDPDMVSTLCLSRAYSPSGHFLSITPPGESDTSVEVRSTIAWSQLESTLDYMILQGSAIAFAGSATPSGQGQHSDLFWVGQLDVQVPAGIAGQCRIVVIGRTLAAGVAVTGSANFERSLAWPFSLSASFSVLEVLPGSSVTVDLAAGATSAVAFITSLDKSAELLGKRAAISSEAVVAALDRAAQGSAEATVEPRLWKLCYLFRTNVHIAGELPEGLTLAADENPGSEPDGEGIDATWGPSLGDNCPRPISNGCSQWGGGIADDAIFEAMPAAAGPGGAGGGGAMRDTAESSPQSSGSSQSSQTIAVRKFFPETWLWQDVALEDGSGDSSKSLTVTAPDTITTWSLEAFAVTPTGFAAVRSAAPLKVFKPFFAEVRLPYSAIRGEELEVIIAVFNYVENSGSLDASLVVTLPDELQLTDDSEGLMQTLTVQEDSAVSTKLRVRPTTIGTFRFTVQVTADGKSDAVERPILVKPEGFTVTETQNIVLEMTENGATGRVDMPLPGTEVSGSARSSVSVVGDMLGPTISGLESLLRIPSGCGEQNMITLAPNVYVTKYLKSVSRLTPQLQQRVTKNMLVGYGRQLTYRLSDGSFSAFGEQDKEGSTWLTAFVLRVFAEVQATGLVSVDPKVMEDAAKWLLSLQESDGCFKNSGKVIHQEMMGGVSDKEADGLTGLTSFVLAAIAKTKKEVPGLNVAGLADGVDKAAECLANKDVTLVYAQLLRIHALFIAEKKNAADATSEALALSTQVSGESERYWTSGEATTQTTPSRGYGPPKTLDVELTGYGVLVLSLAQDLGSAFEGARWLLKRRSALGGYASTQDTVVALSALGEYATAVAGTSDMTVKLTGGGLDETLTVDSTNFDVMQILDTTAGEAVDVEATGTGQALVVASLTYNLPEKPITPCYDVAVDWFNEEGGMNVGLAGVARGCATPREDCLDKAQQGMWIMSVGLFTGYSAPSRALKDLQKKGSISRFEIEDSRVELYFDHLPKGGCVEFNVTKDYDVRNLQAQPTEFYEYYAPEKAGSTLASFQMKEYVKLPEDGAQVTDSAWSMFTTSSQAVVAFAVLAVWH